MKRKVKFTWHEQHGEIFTNSKSQTCQSNPPQCILGSVTDFPFNQITLGGRFTLAPGEANRPMKLNIGMEMIKKTLP